MEFIDLKAQYEALKDEINRGINTVLSHGQFIMGAEVKELEQQLADFTGRKYCLTCANGTDALQLLYMAYGIGTGDAVFCPDITFIATTEPACMLGAMPVFCDIDEKTYNISPQSLERQINAVIKEGRLTPKAVVAVDILGNPCDFEALTQICVKYDLILIEDAAQSFGAFYKGKFCGAFGHGATTSFFPAKPLGCYGDGGAVLTDNAELAVLIDSLRIHGKGPSGKYDNVRIGLNSRLDALQAAILLPKLKALKKYETEARQKIAKRYNDAFRDAFITPYVEDGAMSIYAQYALLASDKTQRDKLVAHLSAQGIPNMIYYPTPQHMLPVFSGIPSYNETFANSNDYCARTFSLPMHPYLEDAEQDKIISTVLGAL